MTTPQPIWILELTHDEMIALAGAIDLLREELVKRNMYAKEISLRDVTTIYNLNAIEEKFPEESWFDVAEVGSR